MSLVLLSQASFYTYAYYKYTHKHTYTQALKEEIVPTPQCFQLSHQVTQVFMMQRKICTLFPSLRRTMPGTLLGCMAHVYRRKKKREKIIPFVAQVPEALVFSEYLVGASKECAPLSQVQLVFSSLGICIGLTSPTPAPLNLYLFPWPVSFCLPFKQQMFIAAGSVLSVGMWCEQDRLSVFPCTPVGQHWLGSAGYQKLQCFSIIEAYSLLCFY